MITIRKGYARDPETDVTATMSTKLLSESDVEAVLDVGDALSVVERTYVEINRGRVLNPPKLSMHMGDDGEWPDRNAFSIDMPAYVDWLDAVGMKWAVATWDADTDVPISSLILLYDLDDGRFRSVMEGMHLTGVRTALQSAVGLKHLLSTSPDSVGVFGAGFQAAFQLSVIDDVFDIDQFFVYDIDHEKALGLRERLGGRIDARITVGEAPDVVAQSDAVLTVTDSKIPVLTDDVVDDVELVVALGSYQELPDETIESADRIVVDHVEQCLQRGALEDMADRNELSASDLDATIGEVLDGTEETPDSNGDQTVFVPIGLGALDVAMAERVYTSIQSDTITEFNFG
jgi:ornithine cyclodeaminase/alanine dehydrogenase